MRDERFHPKAGGFSKNTRLAFDDRPTAERLDDDSLPSRGGAPRNDDDDENDENDDFVSSSSSDAPPPLVSALAVPSRLLARLSPRRVAERAAFRHLARAARRLDLVASMRARRAGTTRRLKRAWRVARSVAAADPTAAPALTLLATALAREAKAAETFSRLKRDARLGLRDAAARLRAFAAKNAWAAEVLLVNAEEAHDDANDVEKATRRFAEDASSRLMRLSDAERRLSERAFAALAGADPRAFAPSAETLAETRLTNASKKNATRRVKRDEAAKISPTSFPKRAPTRADGLTDPKHAPRLSSRDVVRATMGPIRPIRPIGDETRERVSHAAAFEDGNETAKRRLDDSVSEDPEDPEDPEDRRRRACSWRDPEDPDCFSQSELLTSSQREAIDTGNGGHESRAARGSGSRRHDSIGGSIVSAEEKQKKNDDADDADAPREIKRNDVESESTETTSLPAIRATQTQSQSR